MRSGEADKLRWTDLDFEARLVRITPEKGSNPRILKLSSNALAMLNRLSRESNLVFGGSLYNIRRTFERQRKKLAVKLGNPRFNQIMFHTLRHWKATMEYAKTKSLPHVQQILGHKSMLSTTLYVQLVNFESDDFYSETARNVEEAQKLVESGFEFVCDIDNVKLFRKRK